MVVLSGIPTGWIAESKEMSMKISTYLQFSDLVFAQEQAFKIDQCV